jgi:Replication-relaxation
LFFSSVRRAQDRLRFLYEERVLDRFYPPRPYGLGKPQAHWLLDEAGAILVAASLGLERKRLGWQRRDDWASYPQLLHRLEANRFVTDLIAATLADGSLGVSEWWGSRTAASQLCESAQHGRPIPDGSFFFETAASPIECYLEGDRGTETLARLTNKLKLYWHAEVHSSERGHINVLFVVPTERRLRALADAVAADTERRRQARDNWFTPSWPLLAALTSQLTAQGPLAHLWRPLADPAQRLQLSELRARTGLAPIELARSSDAAGTRSNPTSGRSFHRSASRPRAPFAGVPQLDESKAPVIKESSPVEQMRERLLAEARRDAQQASARPKADWTSSAIDGLMLDPDEEPDTEERR